MADGSRDPQPHSKPNITADIINTAVPLPPPATTTVRNGAPEDDTFVAEAFEQMWLDIGYAPHELVADARSRTQSFIVDARARLDLRSAIAESEGRKIGCAVAQRFDGLYPLVLDPRRRTLGYVWGVYVNAEFRRKGLGAALAQHCVEAMRAVGCHEIVLHAAPMGRNVYEGLGFAAAHEMRLKLSTP